MYILYLIINFFDHIYILIQSNKKEEKLLIKTKEETSLPYLLFLSINFTNNFVIDLRISFPFGILLILLVVGVVNLTIFNI